MANSGDEGNSVMAPAVAGAALEWSAGSEGDVTTGTTSGDREDLPGRYSTLEEVMENIVPSDISIEFYMEAAAAILDHCRAASSVDEDTSYYLECCLYYIDTVPSREFVRGSPLHYQLRLELGALYLQKLEYERTKTICNDILAEVHGTELLQYFKAGALRSLGYVYKALNQASEAEKTFEKYFELARSLPDARNAWQESVERYRLMSEAYLYNSRRGEVVRFSAKGLQVLEESEHSQRPFMGNWVNRRRLEFHKLLGAALHGLGDLHNSLKNLEDALAIHVKVCGDYKDPPMPPVDLYWYLGHCQSDLGYLKEAKYSFQQGLASAHQSGDERGKEAVLLALIQISERLASTYLPELAPGNFLLDNREANQALQTYLEMYRRIERPDPLGIFGLAFYTENFWNLKDVEEKLMVVGEAGNLELRIQLNFFICEERVLHDSPNRDEELGRQAFDACWKCLTEWESIHGDVLISSQDLRIKLAGYAYQLGKYKEAEELLQVLLRRHQISLTNMLLGGTSDEHALHFQESKKSAILCMIRVQVQLASQHMGTSRAGPSSMTSSVVSEKSDQQVKAGMVHTLKALMWSERSRAKASMFHLAPGFSELVKRNHLLEEGKVVQLFRPDINPEFSLEDLSLDNDPLLDDPRDDPRNPYKRPLDHVKFNFDDVYAINFIAHAVRGSKMVFVEYFIMSPETLLIIVIAEAPSSSNEGILQSIRINVSIVDVRSKLDESTKQEALQEIEDIAQKIISGSGSDPISAVNADRFYTNEIITGLVAKTHRLMIEVQKKLALAESGAPVRNVKKEEDEIDSLYSVLYGLLIQPIEKHLKSLTSDHNLVFIPHEDMGLIPFAALLDDNKVPLIEKFAVTIAPSIFCVRLCEKLYEKKAPCGGGELLVGRKTGYPEGLEILNGAYAEVEAVQGFCESASRLTDETPDGSVEMKNMVKSQMQTASWLHFAVHGVVSPRYPRGSIILGCDDNSHLTGDEIGQAGPLPARAAVLSACRTALGSIRGEGILGFARAFMIAGVPITILSMWEVRDNFCKEFMTKLYSELRNGYDVPHAMQKAILSMKKEEKKSARTRRSVTAMKQLRWRLSDWAAFACYGHPGVKFVEDNAKLGAAEPWQDMLLKGKGVAKRKETDVILDFMDRREKGPCAVSTFEEFGPGGSPLKNKDVADVTTPILENLLTWAWPVYDELPTGECYKALKKRTESTLRHEPFGVIYEHDKGVPWAKQVKVRIYSPWLTEVLSEFVPGVFAVNEETEVWVKELFHVRDKLREKGDWLSLQQPSSSDINLSKRYLHLCLLLRFMEKECAAIVKKYETMRKEQCVSWDMLWAFLPRGEKIVYHCGISNEEVCGVVTSTKYSSNCDIPDLFIHFTVWDYNGRTWDEYEMTREIYHYQGQRKFTSLETYPLQFKNDPTGNEFLQKGRKFCELSMVPSNKYMDYGGSFFEQKVECYRIKVYAERADGRVMIDLGSFARMNPGYALRNAKPPVGFFRDKKVNQIDITDKETRMYAPAIVYGFSFTLKKWGSFAIRGFEDIVFNESAWDALVMQQERKNLLFSVVGEYIKGGRGINNSQGGMGRVDQIANKGQGCVVLCHGPPGTGKTLTAESIAEKLQCALWPLSVSELGTKAEELESTLVKVLDVAASWGAILLLDEADVYMERRKSADLIRNAMTGVFLRQVEYYRGVLFLTTNRVKTFDEAFRSRMSMFLHYKPLDEDTRKKIWTVLLAGLKLVDPIDDELIEREFSKADFNGREIRNVIQLAVALAKSQGITLNGDHLKQTCTALVADQKELKISEEESETVFF